MYQGGTNYRACQKPQVSHDLLCEPAIAALIIVRQGIGWRGLVLQGCETYHLAELVSVAVELDQFINLTRRVLCFKPQNFFLQSSEPPPLRKYLWRIHVVSLRMDQIQFKMHKLNLRIQKALPNRPFWYIEIFCITVFAIIKGS